MNDALHAYVSGTMNEADAAALEAQLFSEPALGEDAAALLVVQQALRAMAADGPLVPVLRPEELEPLSRANRVVHHAPVNGRVTTAIGSEEFVAVRIPVDLRAATRVDLRFCTPEGTPYFFVNEAPYDAEGVNVVCKAHVAISRGTLRIQVVDQDARVLADTLLENGAAS